MYSEYEPASYISRVSPTPFLMQVAENDFVAVTDEALRAFNNDARENGFPNRLKAMVPQIG